MACQDTETVPGPVGMASQDDVGTAEGTEPGADDPWCQAEHAAVEDDDALETETLDVCQREPANAIGGVWPGWGSQVQSGWQDLAEVG